MAQKKVIGFINPSYQRFYLAHRDEILEAFDTCALHGDFMLREETRVFERNLAHYIGTKYAVSTNSCTDAMFLSLKAMGVGPGDEVLTVSHTFIATLQAIVHTGATPVLVDVGADELMDMAAAERALTPKTRAILPVHFHGRICDMSKFSKEILKNAVIEDAAQALGATQGGKKAGSFGLTGCFSFNFPKLMGAYGDAGGVVTDNEEMFKKLLLLRNHWNITQGSVRQQDYPQPELMGWGWKSRIDNIQAAILNVKFKYLDGMLLRRMEIANRYNEAWKDLPLHLPSFPEGSVVQEYIVRTGQREKFAAHMAERGIELLIRDTTPNHKLKGLGLEHFNLPVTESIAKEAVRIPIYPELEDDEVSYIIDSVKAFFND